MTFGMRRREAEERNKERRDQREQREDAAGKLLQKVPDLGSLSIDVTELRPDGCIGNTHYIRRIIVDHAPALFEIPCSFPKCEQGGYDLTSEVLGALAAHETRFEGQLACRGYGETFSCSRVLRYVGTATYHDAPPRATVPQPHDTAQGQ
jgi:hypothetical protein